MKKVLKILSFTVISLVLVAAIIFGLFYFKVLKAPNFIAYIPVVGSLLIDDDEKITVEQTELEKVKEENARLKNTITAKQEEIRELQNQISEMEKEQKIAEDKADELAAEIAKLNEEILSLKTSNGDKKAAYKDMAGYFTEMKSQDAADILSRLKDEDIIGIINEMSKDVAAEMLQKMDRNKAAALTQKMLVTN